MKQVLTAIGAVALLTLVSIVYFGTKGFSRAKEYAPQVEAAADTFYHHFNAGEYEVIYNDLTNEQFRRTGTYEDFGLLLYSVREKLGKVIGREKNGWKINLHTPGTFMQVQYTVHRETADSVDSFTFKQDGNTWRVQSYHVNSPELVR